MSFDYPDWNFPMFLAEQSQDLYFADIYTKLLANLEIKEARIIKDGATLFVIGSVKIIDDGLLFNMGRMIILEL